MDTIRDDQEIDSFLERNVPISAHIIVQTIGDMGRRIRRALSGKSDFPLSVTIVTQDGRTIETTLEKLFTDDGSQADGTFYFTDPVRPDNDKRPNKKFLHGNEIRTITIRD